jgi:hypothetical protein
MSSIQIPPIVPISRVDEPAKLRTGDNDEESAGAGPD